MSTLQEPAAINSNSRVGLCAVINSALMYDRFRKTNDMKPFVQCSNVDLLGNTQCVFKFDAKIPHRAIDLSVSE